MSDQPKYAQTGRSLPISLLRTRELIMENVRPMLARHDITEQQWRVIRVVSELGPSDATTIADQACILAPSLSRILKTLIEKGVLISVKDANDGRRSVVALTKEGQAFLDRVQPESTAIFSELREAVGSERWEQLVTLLQDIRQDLKSKR